jgi:hypothetical protein
MNDIIDSLELEFKEIRDEFIEAQISSELRIQIDPIGGVRWIKSYENLSVEYIQSTYQSAIDKLFGSSNFDITEYAVCLIIKGDSVVSQYMNMEENIMKFSTSEFNETEPDYYELNDRKIKISFGRYPRTIRS